MSRNLLVLGGICGVGVVSIALVLAWNKRQQESKQRGLDINEDPNAGDHQQQQKQQQQQEQEHDVVDDTLVPAADHDLQLEEHLSETVGVSLQTKEAVTNQASEILSSPAHEPKPEPVVEQSAESASKGELSNVVMTPKPPQEEPLHDTEQEAEKHEEQNVSEPHKSPKRRRYRKKKSKPVEPKPVDSSLDQSESSDYVDVAPDDASPTDVTAVLKAKAKKGRSPHHKSAAAAAAAKELQNSNTDAAKKKKKNKSKYYY
jgi:hypothetical protein